MANQQLLDYIRQQLQQGVGREQIKSSLLANGWQETDIDETLINDAAIWTIKYARSLKQKRKNALRRNSKR